MTRLGRKPLKGQLVERLEGSDMAKQRLQQIIYTLTGDMTIAEACAALGIQDSRFHQLRSDVLQVALEHLEPRPLGRPARPAPPGEPRVQELERQVRELTLQTQAAILRLELAQTMPHVCREPNALKKTTSPPT